MLLIINVFNESDTNRLKKGEKSFFNSFEDNRNIHYLDYKNNSEGDILGFIQKEENNLGVIIFTDNELSLSHILYRCFFIAKISIDKMPDSYISKQISQKRKQFNAVWEAFQSANMIEPLRLPFRSFASDTLKEFDSIMSNIDSDFKNRFERNLSELKRIYRKPMKRSSSKQKYYVDDKNLYFSLGKERHARHETNVPHTLACDLSARYRFGCKIDDTIHFNVCNEKSSENRLTIELLNCHDEVKKHKEKTHINIFSNDYMT